MSKFTDLCETLKHNFKTHPLTTMCYNAPRPPTFTKPIGTKYFAFLESLLESPKSPRNISKSTQQNLRWSGLVNSENGKYQITELGREYVKLAKQQA